MSTALAITSRFAFRQLSARVRHAQPSGAPAFLTLFASACLASFSLAQQQPADVPAVQPGEVTTEERSEAVEAYLADHGMLDVLAAHLRSRVDQQQGLARAQAAEQLARLYVSMLAKAPTRDDRAALEDLARKLLDAVPDADAPDLRIDLAKAAYLACEGVAERHRLRAATSEEVTAAAAELQGVLPTFSTIATRLDTRVDALAKREEAATDEDAPGIRQQLAEARRLRSLASYYEGWGRYYLALLTSKPALAHDAIKSFGVILNALPGKVPSLDRLPVSLLEYEHVARSVLGVALSYAAVGDDVSALRWIEQLETATNIPPSVEDQVFSRKLIILASGDRWADAAALVRRRRTPRGDGTQQPMTSQEARLLAVLTLETLRSSTLREGFREPLNELTQMAFADIIARGEIAQVVDLVRLYGTLPLGSEGFIVAYVRAVEAFEEVRARHVAGTKQADAPTRDAAVVNAYHQAAELLHTAVSADDARKFPEQLAQAHMRRGLALYYAGDMETAADSFEAASSNPGGAGVQQDALWYAIVSLDGAMDAGKPSLRERRDRLATLYIRSFPDSDNATRLLLRMAASGDITDDEAIDILLKVPRSSPVYAAARRQASKLLYQAYKRAGAAQKEFAALRFADVAEEVIRADYQLLLNAQREKQADLAQSIVLRVRQLADAVLAQRVPDLPRVESALDLLPDVASRSGASLESVKDELTFRRLQIARARSDDAALQTIASSLQGSSGPFAAAADRVLYQWSVDRARAAGAAGSSATRANQDVVRFGLRILSSANAKDHSTDAVRDEVAKAAIAVFRAEKSADMRDLAIRMDSELVSSGVRTIAGLRRLASMRAEVGDAKGSAEAWTLLMQGFDAGSTEWYECRVQSLRQLALVDPAAAAEVLRQHDLLFSSKPPSPWDAEMESLRAALPAPRTSEQQPGGGAK